jgi:hypothetical protein
MKYVLYYVSGFGATIMFQDFDLIANPPQPPHSPPQRSPAAGRKPPLVRV